jgi:hypothetical protein
MDVERYGTLIEETFDVRYRERAETGELLVLHLRPWRIGQPFRIGVLEDALRRVMRREGVWSASGGAIVDAYRRARP